MRIARQIEQLGLAILEEKLSSSEVDRLLADLTSYPFTRSRAPIRHAMTQMLYGRVISSRFRSPVNEHQGV